MQGKLRSRHNCVYLGANLGDLGRWRDGPCKWIRSTVDCLCKKVDEKKIPLLLPVDEDIEEEKPVTAVTVPVVTTDTTSHARIEGQLVENQKKGQFMLI